MSRGLTRSPQRSGFRLEFVKRCLPGRPYVPVQRSVFRKTPATDLRKENQGHMTGVRERLAAAVQRRFDALSHTTGLNEEVFDSLVLMAAKEWTPEAVSEGSTKF